MEPPPLATLVASLDDTVLRVAHAAGDLQAPVEAVTILDRNDPHTVRAGTVVLAVSVDPAGDDAVAVVDRACRAGATAVVLRANEDLPPRLIELAGPAGVSLLTVPQEMDWGQLYSLVRTATVGAGVSGEEDAAGVPVGDLFALADAVAAAVGAPVTIEDPQWRVLAYSNLDQPIDEPRRATILGRTPPAEWRERLEQAGVTRALRTRDAAVRFEAEELSPRVAAPVRAGNELLGSIWLAEGEEPLGRSAEEELERFAQLAAVHLIAHRASEDIHRRARGAYVREVLEGRVPPGAIRARGPYTVLAFRLHPRADHWKGDPERILSIVSLYAESLHAEAMCALLGDCFWVLAPTPRGESRRRLLEVAEKVVDRVERTLGAILIAGIGESVARVADVPRTRHSAEQALAVLGRRGAGSGVAHIDDVRAHAALLDLLDVAAAQPALREGPVARLIEHDRRHRSEHVPTLRAYLDAHGDVAGAATRLGIHPNTLRYRLRRLAEAGGLNLDEPDERFMAELELRLHAHRPAGEK